MSTMNAVEITEPGGPEVLKPTTRPRPEPAAGEVLIEVKAAGVNRPDVFQRLGFYPPPPGASDLPGMEVSGVIAGLGEGVSDFQLGEAVCALLPGGGYAEFAVASALQCLPKPDNLSFEEAASLPETVFTVWTNVFERAGFKAGDTVLIHGGASGIGVAAIQMVKALGGRAFATAGGAARARACEAIGAERGIDYKTEDFAEVVLALTDNRGVDIVLDMVGGDYLMKNERAAAVEGRIVMIAFLQGAKPAVDLNLIMQKRLTLTGSTLRGRTPVQKGAIRDALRAKIWPLIQAGQIKPVIFKTFPLAEAAQAHQLMESNTHIGKIVLTT